MIVCGICAGEVNRKGGFSHSPTECIDYLLACLEESRQGRERDREEFRQGVATWQTRISEARKERDTWKIVADLHLNDVCKLRNSVAGVEKDAFAAAAAHLRAEAQKLPLQHEHVSKGCSTYNWMRWCANFLSPLVKSEPDKE